MDDIKRRTRAFLSRFFRKHELQDEEDIFALGFVNSLFAMQLVVFLEKEFGIRIDGKDIKLVNFQTINRIADLVAAKTKLATPNA